MSSDAVPICCQAAEPHCKGSAREGELCETEMDSKRPNFTGSFTGWNPAFVGSENCEMWPEWRLRGAASLRRGCSVVWDAIQGEKAKWG